MTVQTETSRSGPYAGAGTTGPFTVGFRFLADSHLRVIKTSAAGIDTDLVLTTDYSVTGAGDASGTLTLVATLPVGASLTIIRDVPFTQEADYVDNDSFPAESHETALDKLTMQTQQIKEAQDRALALSPTSDAGVSTDLPNPVANNILAWNPSADALQNLDPSAIAGVVSYGTFLAETFNGTGVATNFVVTGNPLTIGNLDVSVDGVVQTAGKHFTFIPPSTIRFITGAPAAGTDNVLIRYGSSLAMGEAASIVGQTATGTALITAVDAAAARDAIGALSTTGGRITGALEIGPAGSLRFEGSLDDSFETSFVVTNPTAARTITIPDASGTIALTSDIPATVAAATQAQMEAGAAANVYAAPLTVKYSPGVAKAWCSHTGSTPTISASYNVSSITKLGTGDYQYNWTLGFSSINYVLSGVGADAAGTGIAVGHPYSLFATGTAALRWRNVANALTDPYSGNVIILGDFT